MNHLRIFPVFLRIVAAAGALLALFSQCPPPARAAAPMLRQAAPVVLVPNLVAYWAVDSDTLPVASDTSGTTPANNGSYQSSATTSASAPPVPTGNALSFSLAQATNDFISVPSSSSLSVAGPFTVAAWVKPSAPNGTTQQCIVEKWDAGPANGYFLRLNASNYLAFNVFSGTTSYGIDSSPRAIPGGMWTHVAGVYDGTGLTMYHNDSGGNGEPDPTALSPATAPTAGTTTLQIGKDYGANAFGGNIDEVRLYDRALSAAEIAILYTGQPPATGVTAAGGPGMITVSWAAAAGATSYAVLRGTSSGTYTTVVNGVTASPYIDLTAVPGTTYFYSVVAVSVMASADSPPASAMATPPPPPPPPAPTGPGTRDKGKCGCSTIGVGNASLGSCWAALLAAAGLLLPRRRPVVRG